MPEFPLFKQLDSMDRGLLCRIKKAKDSGLITQGMGTEQRAQSAGQRMIARKLCLKPTLSLFKNEVPIF
jgi:hypothetical protein